MNATTKAVQEEFSSHPVTAYINTLTSNSSKRTMLSALKSVIALALEKKPGEVDPIQVYEFAWGTIDPSKLKALRAALLKKYSSAMASKVFAAVRGVLGACFDQELIDADRWMRLQRVKGISIKRNHKTGRCLTVAEIQALARVCAEDETPAGARDDALIGLGYTQGLRVSEFVNLQLKDYDPLTGNVVIRKSKGDKSRTIRASNSTKFSFDEWIGYRGKKYGPLFTRINKAGEIEIAPLTQQSLSKIFFKRADQAGVAKFSPHDLRRSFITNGWNVGIPGPQLQSIAGHSSLSTTAAYDRTSLEEALKSSERLHYPSMRHTT